MNEVRPGEPSQALELLHSLQEQVKSLEFPLSVENAQQSQELRDSVTSQLQDYIIPRFESLHAPLLAVVGGSTGAGKSTLVNALVGYPVTRAGAIRPTTRQPILLHHEDDARWFETERILPDLHRIPGKKVFDRPARPVPAYQIEEDLSGFEASNSLVLVPFEESFPRGIALLDAPDIDSISDANRALARQLLAAADLWIFVTTANRYADAVPWELLHEAADRDITLAVVLDRVPAGVAGEVQDDLKQHLDSKGLSEATLYVVPEAELDEYGMLDPAEVQELKTWLVELALDSEERQVIAERTLYGVMRQINGQIIQLFEAEQHQREELAGMIKQLAEVYSDAKENILSAASDGTLLRGEVLNRWQDFVGAGEFMRNFQSSVSRWRDNVAAFFTGKPKPIVKVEQAIETGLHSVIVAASADAAEDTVDLWNRTKAGRELLAPTDAANLPDDFAENVAARIRLWQKQLMELIQTEGQSKRFTARAAAFGVNGAAVALMLVSFASTGGLAGIEIGIAGGSAVIGQKLLETIFGDEAVRKLAAQAKKLLAEHIDELLEKEQQRFQQLLPEIPEESSLTGLLQPLNALTQQGPQPGTKK